MITVLDATVGGAALGGLFERLVAFVGATGLTALAVGVRRHSRKP